MSTFKNPDVWKQNLAYQIGDFVLYNGTVYMAIKPVPAGTAMSADYWYEFAEGGGGGSSDLTTAHVTVVESSGGETGNIDGPNCSVCTFSTLEGISTTFPAPAWAQGSSVEFDAVLYKGGAYFMYADERSEVESVSGSATKMGEKTVLITGDCTITITFH